jgi:hypothetical protein
VNRQHSESQKRLDPGPTPAHLPSDPGLAASPGEEGFDLDEVLAKYDRESAFRRLAGPVGRLIALVLIGFSLFQLYTAAFGVLDARIQRAIHLAFGMSLVFLLYPARKGGSRTSLPWWDVLLAVASAAVSLYRWPASPQEARPRWPSSPALWKGPSPAARWPTPSARAASPSP